MSRTLSELLNGQLDARETALALREFRDPKPRDQFTVYTLIGDTLRGNSTPDDGYTNRILERIRRESVEAEEGFDPVND